ncbi:MAG: DUF305 domain-containing protein [Saprospiraceae bacterium]|nr:DUF305 domain-containing protein [Pyrinomonadaceae bacterium]
MQPFHFNGRGNLRSLIRVAASRSSFLAAGALTCFLSVPIGAQQSDSTRKPVLVQPGAPGQATQTLPQSTRATLPLPSPKDAGFMQGMIMHHAQAVEMTALIESRTENTNIRLLGARISQSQSDEMKFMKRWLEIRAEPVSMPMADMPGSHSHGQDPPGHQILMPGMLSSQQMNELKKAKGSEFDRLFLTGMIQHHIGALDMVKDLFDTAGAGQEAELFNFATDVDSSQRAEINIMRNMLGEKPVK